MSDQDNVTQVDFRSYPKTIGEIKTKKTNDASDWTPKDVLIHVLRNIDSGTEITKIVICYEYKDKDATCFGYLKAIKSISEACALLDIVKHKLLTMLM